MLFVQYCCAFISRYNVCTSTLSSLECHSAVNVGHFLPGLDVHNHNFEPVAWAYRILWEWGEDSQLILILIHHCLLQCILCSSSCCYKWKHHAEHRQEQCPVKRIHWWWDARSQLECKSFSQQVSLPLLLSWNHSSLSLWTVWPTAPLFPSCDFL